MAEGRPPGADPRDGVDLLRGLLICGLVLTAGTGEGWLHASIRGALPVVMGLAFGVAIAGAERGGRRVSPLWMLHLLATWLLTLWPGMWGNREVVRTCAIAGCAVILLRGVGVRARAGLGVAVVAVAVAAWLPDAPHW
ncbi:MAG TPA: hypothetical protein VLA09_14190, partial [Longimicrobiales bacterium]|nr:hypothetical protein [Longimicrobiales bacterium]